jgi:N12 class adenine-specific DNA methylase
MAFDDEADPAPDPQGVVDSLLRAYQPDVAPSLASDPQATVNRLLRKTVGGEFGKLQTPQPAQQQPQDLSKYGEEVTPGTAPEAFNPPDLSKYGEEVTPKNAAADFGIKPEEPASATEVFGQSLGRAPAETIGGAIKGTGIQASVAEKALGHTEHVQPYYDAYNNWDKLSPDQQQATRQKVQQDPHLLMGEKVNVLKAFEDRAAGTPPGTPGQFAGTPVPGQGPMEQAGETIKGLGAKAFPLPEGALEQHPTAASIGSGLGSMLTAALTGNVLAGAGMMGLSSSASTFDKGIADGATPEQAAKVSGLTAIVNTAAGALPVGVVLQPLARSSPGLMGWATSILTRAVNDGIIFTGIGEAQEYIAAQLASHYYDPEVAKKSEYKEDINRVISEFATGAIAGGVSGAVHPGPSAVEDFLRRAEEGPVPPPRETGSDRGAAWRAEIDDFLRQRQAANPAPTGTPQVGGPPPAAPGAGPTESPPGPEAPPSGGAPPPPEAEVNSPEYWQQKVNEAPAGAHMNINGRDYVSDGSGFNPRTTEAPRQTPPRETAPQAPLSDRDMLLRGGYSDQDIAGMGADERAAAIEELKDLGIVPSAPKQGTSQTPAEDIQTAAGSVNKNATAKQAEAGNVQLGHYKWAGGIPITIEAPSGGVRKFVSPDGKEGGTTVGAAYGRFPGLPPAKDGQAPDVFVGNSPKAQMVYVVDEVDPRTKQYRQSKSFVDFNNAHAALAAYLGTSSKTPEMVGGVSTIPIPQFVEMAKAGGLAHPASPMMSGLEGIYGFTTSRGSTYAVRGDGTTLRNKAPGHADGGVGPQPTSVKTVYMTPQDGQRMGHPQGAPWRVIDHQNGTMSLATQNPDGKWGVSPESKNVPYSTTPQVGMTPLELWGKGQVYGRDAYDKKHLGTAITRLETARPNGGKATGQESGAPVQGPGEAPREGTEGGPIAPTPEGGPREVTPEDLKVVETALESVGEDPAELPHNIAQTAAEILAEENGVPRELAYPLAFIRVMHERGLISREAVEEAFRGKTDQVEIVLGTGVVSQRELPTEARGAATGGEVEPRPGEGAARGPEAGEQGREEGQVAGAGEGAVPAEVAPERGPEHGAQERVRAEHPAEAGGAEPVADHEQPAAGVREPAAEHAPEATSEPAGAADQSEPAEGRERKPARPAAPVAAPESLLHLIAAEGGLKRTPDLLKLGLHTNATVKVPGIGYRNLLREAGMTMDELAEKMEAAGYLPKTLADQPPDSGVHRRILEMIDEELNRGRVQKPVGKEEAGRHELEGAEDEARAKAHEDLANELKDQGFPLEKAHEADLGRAVELILKGATLEDAWERATLEGAINDGDLTREETGIGEETPFDLHPADRTGGEEAERPGERPVGDGEKARTERTEAGEQGVIPGAERISDAELAQRKADEGLKPKVQQKPADIGLFGDEDKQSDLVDLTRKPVEPPPEAASEPVDERDEFDKAFDAAIEAERKVDEADAVEAAKPKPVKADTNEAWYDGLSPAERSKLIKGTGRADLADTFQNLAWKDLSPDLRAGVVRVAGRTRTPELRKPVTPQVGAKPRAPRPERTTGQAARSAAENTLKAADDAMAALTELFGGPKVSAGFTWDEDTWQKAKPLFQQAAQRFREAFKDVAEVVSKMVNHLRRNFNWSLEMIDRARPYLRKFVEQVRAGTIRLEETPSGRQPATAPSDVGETGERPPSEDGRTGEPPGTDGNASLEGKPPGDVSELGEAGGTETAGSRPSGPIPAGGTGIPSSGDADVGRAGAGGSGVATERPGERPPEPALRPNYHIVNPEALVGGGPKARFNRNRAAIQALRSITDEDRDPTPEELDAMASYTGWGAFGQQLFQGTWERGNPQKGWETENQWLRDHLGQDEWRGAQSSIINAHYTDPPTVMAMWQAMRNMGFDGGRVLEPSMGIGNFFGLMPRDVMANSHLTGIELDPLTGGMAKLLYPRANVRIMPYQDSKAADGFYDAIIGNWPFSAVAPADRRYNPLSASLHDYFFAKAIDQVRPGGIVMGITNAGTMDKIGKPVRSYLAKRAELLGAFRLPTGAFGEYAGTNVVADLLVLKKRETPLVSPEGSGWLESVERDVPGGQIRVNEYWATHPDHVLGELAFGHRTTSGRPGMIVNRPADFADRLAALPSKLPADGYGKITRGNEPRFESNNTVDRQGAVTNKGDKLYVVKGDHLAPLEDIYNYKTGTKRAIADKEAQLHALVGMRRAYGALLDAEREGEENVPDLRKALQKQYLDFNKTHGQIIKSDGLKILKKVEDPFAAVLASLETPDGSPAKILFESTIRGKRKIEAPNVRDAFVLQRNQSTKLDLDAISQAAGKPKDEVIKELEGENQIYRLPGGGYEVADVFLSGNVRRKLREAVAAKEAGDHLMEKPIEAFKKVVPKDIPYYKIEAKLGAPWVPQRDYQQFIADLLGVDLDKTLKDNANAIRIEYRAERWKVRLSDPLVSRPEATDQWGHARVPFNKMLQSALSNVPVKIMDYDNDGVAHLNQQLTDEANNKIARIREEFSTWTWKDGDRRIRLEHAYNDTMNAIGDPLFDGSFLEFPGMALQRGDGPFNMRKHQVDATWRGIVNRAGLYAHEVGTGKTYTMGAIAVESRRYGIARKPMILAHNANSASVAAEIQEQYPGAKVLYLSSMAGGGREEKPEEPPKEGEIKKPPTPEEIEKAKEKAARRMAAKEDLEITMNRIANDDWDAIVVPHSLIDRFALTERTLNGLAAEQIAALEQEAMQAALDEGHGSISVADMDDEDAMKKVRSPTAKNLVKQRNQIKESITKMAQRASREGAMSFENMGIDMILVDEGHEFKKPPITTAMKMKGLNTGVSGRSIALRFLTDYIKSINNGRGVHIFTGTPITNTLSEIFHMQRYVMDDVMKQDGIASWDPWFATFADSATDVELTSTGQYEPVTRLSSFVNTAELRQMLGQFMDIVFADNMPEFKPREINGKNMTSQDLTPAERNHLENGMNENSIGRPYKHVVNDIGPMSAIQQEALRTLAQRAQEFKDADGNGRRRMLNEGDLRSPIIVDGMAASAALDQRLYDRNLPAHPEGKVARAVKNILAEYKASDKASQVVFVDQGYNDTSLRTRRDAAGNALRNHEGKPIKERMPVHNLVKGMIDDLVAGGIPRDEIAIVDGKVSKEKRKQIADGMNSRRIRVVIGNRQALGVGVNMQRYLRAMHHLDAPWMPGVLEQSNGRGWRQGNLWNTVKEYRYITDRLDGRRWQVLSIKDRFIKAFLKADKDVRTIEGDAVDDTEQETIGDLIETMSTAAGDPRVLRKKQLEAQIEKLQRRERLHTYGQHDSIEKADSLRVQISNIERQVVNLDADSSRFKKAAEGGFNAKIGGQEFTDKKLADDKLASMVTGMEKGTKLPLGSVYGFKLKADWSATWHDTPDYDLVGETGEFTVRPTIASIEGVLRALPARISRAQADITDKRGSIARLEEAAKEPFGQAKLLADRKKQLSALEADMSASPAVPPSWLRTGAPVDTEVYAHEGDKVDPRVVTGHRWGNDNWYVQTTKGEMPYLDVVDENGMRTYEPRPFIKPIQDRPTPAAAPPPRTPPRGRTLFSVAPERPRSVLPDALRHQLESEIARATGGRVRVSLETNLSYDEQNESHQRAMAKHGLTSMEGSTLLGSTEFGHTLGDALVRISMDHPEDAKGVLYHELDHIAERYLYTDEENELRRRETPRMRDWLSDHGVDPTGLDDVEVRAETTRVYIENLDEGLTGPDFGRGLHMVIRRMLNHLWTMIRRIRNTLFERGGMKTWQDVIDALHRGEVFKREEQPLEDWQREEWQEGQVAASIRGDIRDTAANIRDRAQRAFMDMESADKILDIASYVQNKIAPMGSFKSPETWRAAAKDYANTGRWIDYNFVQQVERLKKNFRPEQRRKMWDAANEEGEILEAGYTPVPGEGLSTLNEAERAFVDGAQSAANEAWARAQDLEMVEGDGKPSYVPRMAVAEMEGGRLGRVGKKPEGGGSSEYGRGFATKTGSMNRRKYHTAAETEAAMKAKFGENVTIAKDIGTLLLAAAKLNKAVFARQLINRLEAMSATYDVPLVSDSGGSNYFTMDHPAFYKYKPDFAKNPETGSIQQRVDQFGNRVWKRVPMYIHNDFEGPLKAVLGKDTGKVYQALMTLRGKAMTLVMYSPIVHNLVEASRALPAVGWRLPLMYTSGSGVLADRRAMTEAIRVGGLVPIGKRFALAQDVTSLLEHLNAMPGRGLASKGIGYITRLISARNEDWAKEQVDKLGDFWHNYLLWDQVAKLQAGLYAHFRDKYLGMGLDRATAVRVAAHLANRYAGALPLEAMSTEASKMANLVMFSRTYTLGNLGAMKDVLTGLPKDVKAQILRDAGQEMLSKATSAAKRKAASTIAWDIFINHVSTALFASAAAVAFGVGLSNDDKFKRLGGRFQHEVDGYARRFGKIWQNFQQHPVNAITHPWAWAPQAEYEKGKRDQPYVVIGHNNKGAAVYARNPVGKIGEEFENWATEPLEEGRRKEGVFARPTHEVLANDRMYPGALDKSPIYDPRPGASMVKNVGRVMATYLEAIGPWEAIKSAGGVLGVGDYAKKSTLEDIGRIAGGAIGTSISTGISPGAERFQKQDEKYYDKMFGSAR